MKEDKSAFVPQRNKIKDKLEIREFPWTPKQIELINLIQDKATQMVLIKGPAGSSKTLTSVFTCLKLLNDKKISDIIFLRSAVESSDSHLGALPGLLEEKMQFYEIPFIDKLNELLPKNQIDTLLKEKRVSSFPPNFCRGLSFNCKGIILDEAQNSSIKEIITIMTRIGKYCKCLILADPQQTDLHNGKKGGFEKLFELFSDDESKKNGIYTFKFDEDDIVRSGLTQYVVKKVKDIKS